MLQIAARETVRDRRSVHKMFIDTCTVGMEETLTICELTSPTYLLSNNKRVSIEEHRHDMGTT